ncbi:MULTISPECIES: hypothetical protein [Cupriavidus]|uniref:hypothetical protein n=1 Tax=Cupriavidus sp. DF5525 TaxID=3160989 RepID=UPI0003B03C97|nr:hypothetical protein N234_32145 [Ralstonia pickettii DTP0602]
MKLTGRTAFVTGGASCVADIARMMEQALAAAGAIDTMLVDGGLQWNYAEQ